MVQVMPSTTQASPSASSADQLVARQYRAKGAGTTFNPTQQLPHTITAANTQQTGSDPSTLFKRLVERSISAWSSLRFCQENKYYNIHLHAEVLRGMKSLDEVLHSRTPMSQMWFFQLKSSFMQQSRFTQWDESRLDDYVLIPVVAGFVNKTDCVFISHFWRTDQHPDPDGLDFNLLRQDLADSRCSYIWLDWTCLPQGKLSNLQKYYFQVSLPKLPLLMRDCAYSWRFPDFRPRLWILFEVACWLFNHVGCVEYDDMAQYVADCKRMVEVGAKTVVAQRGYKCTNGGDTKIVTSWLELLVLLYKHVPSTSTRRDLLDTVEGFHATTTAAVEFYSDDHISVDMVRGMLSVGNKTYCFTPLPPPSIARPNVSRTTGEAETSESHDVSPDQEMELIETATRDLESDNPKRLAETAELIAELLKQKRNPAAAETLARAMKTYSDRTYGQEHVSAIINSHRLALAYKAVGKHQECDALLNKTVTLKGNLVDEYLQQRRFAEAASICRQIVDFDDQFLTRADPEAIRDLGVLGTCLYHQGKHAEADEYLGLAADLSELILGRNNEYTQLVLLDFSNNCAKLGKFDEADEAIKKVRMVPENHPHASVIRQAKMIPGKGDNTGWFSKKSRDRAQSASRTSKADGIATPSPASLAKIVEIDETIAATEGLASGIDSVIQADFDYVSGDSGPWGSEEILVLDKAAISELLYKVLQDDQTAGFRSRSVVTNEGDEQPPYVQLNSIGGTFRPYRIAKRQDGRLVLYGHAALYRAKRALDRAKNPSVTPSAADLITELIDVGLAEGALLAPKGSELQERVQSVGSALNDAGGKKLMLQAHETVRDRLGATRARELEVAWDGVGDWLG